MNDSVGKITEFLAVLNYLFRETDSKNTMKYLDYVARIQQDLNITVDRRKVAKYLDALERISKDDKVGGLLPFKVSVSSKGKGKLYRDNFVLSDSDIENIVSAIEAYQMLSGEETEELKNRVIHNLPSKTKREYLLTKDDSFKSTKLDVIYSKKNYFSSKSYRQKFIITNDTRFGKTEFYPNDKKQYYFEKELKGYIYKYVSYHNKPYLLLMIPLERTAIAVPVQNIKFLNNEDDFDNDPNDPYVFNFKFSPGHEFTTIEQWSKKLLANEIGDLEVVNLKISDSRYAKKILDSIKAYFPNQEPEIRKLFKNFHDLVLAGQGKGYKEAFYVENLITNWDTFVDWYMSDINIIKDVEIITPASFAYRIGSFARDLYNRIRYGRTDNFVEFIVSKQ